VTRGTSSEVLLTDIIAMPKKLHPASKSRATWIVADEVFGQLLDMYINFGSATSGITPPPNWLEFDAQAGCWRLLGLECCPHDHEPGLGSTGDVILADLRLMLIGTRRELTVQRSQKGSTFISDTSNYRITARVDARYWPQGTYTTAAGQTVSPLVILA
jgi:HK97 family phage major capsid protein